MTVFRILTDKHKISYDFIRSLAIECHALDKTAFWLFVAGIHSDECQRTKKVYQEKFTASTLHLAVAIRTLLYQGIESKVACPNIQQCGFFERENEENDVSFNIKDVCDKIIHADYFERKVEGCNITPNADTNPLTWISGKSRNKEWHLQISLNMFCESVLNWINELEEYDNKHKTLLSRKEN